MDSRLRGMTGEILRGREPVTPAKAGVHLTPMRDWIPACAGMTAHQSSGSARWDSLARPTRLVSR
jgi:hypothetical protein